MSSITTPTEANAVDANRVSAATKISAVSASSSSSSSTSEMCSISRGSGDHSRTERVVQPPAVSMNWSRSNVVEKEENEQTADVDDAKTPSPKKERGPSPFGGMRVSPDPSASSRSSPRDSTRRSPSLPTHISVTRSSLRHFYIERPRRLVARSNLHSPSTANGFDDIIDNKTEESSSFSGDFDVCATWNPQQPYKATCGALCNQFEEMDVAIGFVAENISVGAKRRRERERHGEEEETRMSVYDDVEVAMSKQRKVSSAAELLCVDI